jgi:ABC-type arginine transport system permease subunit
LQKTQKAIKRVIQILSLFVLIVDAALLIYYVSTNLVDAVTGQYGTSTYDLVIVSAVSGMVVLSFYLGAAFERKRDSRRRKLRIRTN